MTEPAAPARARIFINYRRDDTAYPAGWLYDRLAEHFGDAQIFKDVDSVELGDDFVEVITTAVGSCDALLALIGDRWLTITDAEGRRRLDNPDDFVRLEIEAALDRGVLVIPILVDGARMPRSQELPVSLAGLVRRQALELSPTRFDFDTNRLLEVLNRTLGVPTAPRAVTPAVPTPKTPTEPSGGGRSRLPPSRRTSLLIGLGGVIAVIGLLLAALLGGSESPPRVGPVIFSDDFSGPGAQWEAHGNGTGGYSNGAYRLRGDPAEGGGGVTSAPRNASAVFPSAPPNIRIDVDARRLSPRDQDAGHGVLCRVSGDDSYAFSVWDDHAVIAKITGSEPYYAELAGGPLGVDPTATTRMQAVCTGDASRQHLVLSLNGQVVLEVTDTTEPHSRGTVGVAVATGSGDNSIEAEFDNFEVREVRGRD